MPCPLPVTESRPLPADFTMELSREETVPLTELHSDTEDEVAETTESRVDKMYTVDEAIEKMGFGLFQILLSVFCGLLWVADAMELMILSILSPALKCQWDLSGAEEATITAVVFVGMLLGGLFWGAVCDIIGRRNGLFAMIIVILFFGVLSALQVSSGDSKIPGYPWLLTCRFGVGLGAGGAGLVTTYYIEFLPVKARGICTVLVAVWWALGTMFGAVLGLLVLGEGGLGWHWFLGLVTIPEAAVLLLFPLFPESARFYLVKGKNSKAEKAIKRVAWYNRKKVPQGRIVSHEYKEKLAQSVTVIYSQGNVSIQDAPSPSTNSDHSNTDGIEVTNADDHPLLQSEEVSDSVTAYEGSRPTPKRPLSMLRKMWNISWLLIFRDGMWKTTLILIPMWVGVTWLYYGSILLTTTLLRYDPHCGIGVSNTSNFSNSSCEDSELDTADYLKIMWTTAAEVPGLIITTILIEILGRKLTLAIDFLAAMIGFFLLFICTSSTVLTLFLFIIRAFATGGFQALYVYSPEVFPTDVRAFAMGVFISMSRIGGIITPYVAQVLLHVSDYTTLALYAFSGLVLAGLSLLLPIETKGRLLRQRKAR